jgi:Na+/H+-dicarboxylate symporter
MTMASSPNLTGRVILGMVVGIIVGLILMNFSPTPIQPGDKLTIVGQDGQSHQVKVAATDRAEKLLDVVIDGRVVGQAVFETSQVEGNVLLPDGTDVRLAGVSFADAANVLSQAGYPAQQVNLEERGTVTVRPVATEIVYVIGELFIRLLRMLVIPLIIATVLVGIASLGDIRKLGNVGKQTFLFYFATMGVASFTGLLMVNLVQPGAGLGWVAPEADRGILAESPSIPDLVLRIVPTNPIQAMAQFDVLGILFFVILVALAILHLGKHKAAPVFNFFESLSDIMFILIRWVMRLAPFGVGALIAYYIGIQNVTFLGTLLQSLGKFALTVAGSLTIHFIFLMVILTVVGKYNPFLFLRQLAPAIATAFGTNSSSATMPLTLTSVNNMGVSKRISGFVVPVGATMNMDGTALFEAVAVMFFAQAYAADLTFGQQIIVALTAILAAVGAAGIPSAGLVTMALVLTAVGLPLAGIGLLFAIDRPLDMLRTVVNITGDAVTSRVVQTWNPDIRKEEDDLATEYEIVEPAAAHGPA